MTERRNILWRLYLFFFAISLAAALGLLALSGVGIAGHFYQAVAVALLASAASSFAVWKVQLTLKAIRESAKRFARGELDFRMEEPQSEELGGLAATLNDMAMQLEERIRTIERQRGEVKAILSAMTEGVIACDRELRILQINQAAAALAGGKPEGLIGRSIYEIIRNRELQELAERTVHEGTPCEGEIAFNGSKTLYLQVRTTPLNPSGDRDAGCLIVMNDITNLRRLEGIRRDFVANVSHELKTPLTSIKGFAETLLDGAMADPDEAAKFCKIISKQVDRLQRIIEDLLSLSRIEQEVEEGQISLKTCSLQDSIENALQSVSQQASDKNITIRLECEPTYTARINPFLFEQVAVNLVDNAIKYSEDGTDVVVSVVPLDAEWEISVTDQGSGIPKQHLERIFERFYRVDKARSRKAGGTGLGLAIVKHIVGSHHGRVTVESEVGRGSTFTVYLPREKTIADRRWAH